MFSEESPLMTSLIFQLRRKMSAQNTFCAVALSLLTLNISEDLLTHRVHLRIFPREPVKRQSRYQNVILQPQLHDFNWRKALKKRALNVCTYIKVNALQCWTREISQSSDSTLLYIASKVIGFEFAWLKTPVRYWYIWLGVNLDAKAVKNRSKDKFSYRLSHCHFSKKNSGQEFNL